MIAKTLIAVAFLTCSGTHRSLAQPQCAIFGDSIGLGLGKALKEVCPTNAEIGILSSVVASRVTYGDRVTIVSLGSNDYPKGLSSDMKALSEARVTKALAQVHAKTGKHLILILPANEARDVVQRWAVAQGVPTISFEAGVDGIHPRSSSYAAMAREVKIKIGQ